MEASRQRPPTEKSPELLPQAAVISLGERRRLENHAHRCVSSGYMSGGGSCTCTIASSAVAAAWASEMARAPGSRFFHFAWKGEVWLGFGVEDGTVRGVYCPAHRAEREARSCGCEALHYAPAPAHAPAATAAAGA